MYQTRKPLKLFIFTGTGKAFGTGHKTRMQDLGELLAPSASLPLALRGARNKISRELGSSPFLEKCKEQGGIEAIFRSFSKISEALSELRQIGEEPCLFLLDLREIDPSPFLEKGSVLTLDNYHPIRYSLKKKNQVLFHDTLAHPRSDLSQVLEQAHHLTSFTSI